MSSSGKRNKDKGAILMISENYEYSWNKLFQSVEYDIYNILDENFGCHIYFANPLDCPIDLYIEEDEFPAFSLRYYHLQHL